MATVPSTVRTPASFWIIAALSLLWNAFGGYDFIMTNLRDPAYVARFPPGMVAYLDAYPAWATAAWALGVWGAVVGSLLLLLRSRFAVIAFVLSLIGLAVSHVYQFAHHRPPGMETPPMLTIMAVIWAAALFLPWYAWRMRRAGVLR